MTDFFETTIKNFSGLSSETKPTIAAGNNIPNGSRWREVDTGKEYHFNLSDDLWYLKYDPSNGVPPTYTGQTASGEVYNIQPGQLNKLRLRPQILNEHAESSRNVIGTVTSTNIVGQIFKASHDNINGIDITVESAAGSVFEDFESYADSAALQVEWVEGTNAATLETTIVEEGNKSMKLQMDTLGDEWINTITSTDFTSYTGHIHIYQDKEYNKAKLRFFAGDGSETASMPLVIPLKNVWYELDVDMDNLTEDSATPVDKTAITKIGFRVEDKEPGKFAYIDHMITTPPPGEFSVKLWDMGASIPVSTTTSIDDGTQYEKIGDLGISGLQESEYVISLHGGKRQYHIDGFVAGTAEEIPANELLTVDNYYLITLNYVDTNISVYGPNPAWNDYYESGYAFTAPDEATAITATGAQEDIQFLIYSVQDVYVSNFVQFMDAAPGSNSRWLMNIEDENMRITGVIASGTIGQQAINKEFSRPYKMVKGSKFELNYNDDASDSVTQISLNFQYFFIPLTANG